MVRCALTQERLKEVLSYNPDTGEFSRIAGGKAGTKSLEYLRIQIDRRLYLAHRLAFLIILGRWPYDKVDHIDGDPSNNRWENLRECSQKENMRNTTRSHTYAANVYFTTGPRKKPVNVKLTVDGVVKSFGYYATVEEAEEIAKAARKQYFGEFSVDSRPI